VTFAFGEPKAGELLPMISIPSHPRPSRNKAEKRGRLRGQREEHS